MRIVPLGQTDLQVSQIALGCMSLTADRRDASYGAVARALELGVNFFDTADVYGRGDSEEILGEALRRVAVPREQVVIASKCGIVFQGMEPDYSYKAYDLSAAYIKRSCEASLQRLDTDYLDLYQPHRVDYLTHPDETARALGDLIQEGKVRHVGVSNYTVDEIRALTNSIRLESLQTQFSLLHLEPLETDLTAVCVEKHMAILCYSPLHKATLTGKIKPTHDNWQLQRETGVVTQLGEFAAAYDVSLTQLALAWLMQLPGGVIPLVGTANAEHIAEAAAATDMTIARDDWYEMLVIGRGRPMPWGQRPYLYTKER